VEHSTVIIAAFKHYYVDYCHETEKRKVSLMDLTLLLEVGM
jgi:hypothetical protein